MKLNELVWPYDKEKMEISDNSVHIKKEFDILKEFIKYYHKIKNIIDNNSNLTKNEKKELKEKIEELMYFDNGKNTDYFTQIAKNIYFKLKDKKWLSYKNIEDIMDDEMYYKLWGFHIWKKIIEGSDFIHKIFINDSEGNRLTVRWKIRKTLDIIYDYYPDIKQNEVVAIYLILKHKKKIEEKQKFLKELKSLLNKIYEDGKITKQEKDILDRYIEKKLNN